MWHMHKMKQDKWKIRYKGLKFFSSISFRNKPTDNSLQSVDTLSFFPSVSVNGEVIFCACCIYVLTFGPFEFSKSLNYTVSLKNLWKKNNTMEIWWIIWKIYYSRYYREFQGGFWVIDCLHFSTQLFISSLYTFIVHEVILIKVCF